MIYYIWCNEYEAKTSFPKIRRINIQNNETKKESLYKKSQIRKIKLGGLHKNPSPMFKMIKNKLREFCWKLNCKGIISFRIFKFMFYRSD